MGTSTGRRQRNCSWPPRTKTVPSWFASARATATNTPSPVSRTELSSDCETLRKPVAQRQQLFSQSFLSFHHLLFPPAITYSTSSCSQESPLRKENSQPTNLAFAASCRRLHCQFEPSPSLLLLLLLVSFQPCVFSSPLPTPPLQGLSGPGGGWGWG